jgi:hypothetical protein
MSDVADAEQAASAEITGERRTRIQDYTCPEIGDRVIADYIHLSGMIHLVTEAHHTLGKYFTNTGLVEAVKKAREGKTSPLTTSIFIEPTSAYVSGSQNMDRYSPYIFLRLGGEQGYDRPFIQIYGIRETMFNGIICSALRLYRLDHPALPSPSAGQAPNRSFFARIFG